MIHNLPAGQTQHDLTDADLFAIDLWRNLKRDWLGTHSIEIEFARRLQEQYAPDSVRLAAENVELRRRNAELEINDALYHSDANRIRAIINRPIGDNELFEDVEEILSAYQSALETCREALEKIHTWIGQFPATGKNWPDSQEPVSYGAAYGSNGERDFMRNVAGKALSALANIDKEVEPVEPDDQPKFDYSAILKYAEKMGLPTLRAEIAKSDPFCWISNESIYRLRNGGNSSRNTVPVHAAQSNISCMPLYLNQQPTQAVPDGMVPDTKRLNYLESHHEWHISIADEEDGGRELQSVDGSINDREYNTRGIGMTLRDAIDAAMLAAGTEKGAERHEKE
jgi:hypothetical protein